MDTLRAYGDLAAERRREWGELKNKTVLAIGGSAGERGERRENVEHAGNGVARCAGRDFAGVEKDFLAALHRGKLLK